MTVVFTDSFTVASDINIDAYPSGSPDYAYNAGSGSMLLVVAADDRVGAANDNAEHRARIIDAAVPNGDQEITLDSAQPNGSGFSTGLACVRMASGADTDYEGWLEMGSANEVTLYRRVAGSGILLASADRGLTGAGTRAFRLRATGTGAQVDLEFQVAATTTLTYSDTDASRLTSGVPGLGAYCEGGETSRSAWVDNLSVDDLISASGWGMLLAGRRNQMVQA